MTNTEVSRGSQSATRDTTHIESFKVGLETYKIAIKSINHFSDILVCKGGIGHIAGKIFRERSEDRVGEREGRIVSANVVRLRICPYLACEAPRVNLIVVRRITPTTESGRRIVPDGRVVDIVTVYTEVTEYRSQRKRVYDVDKKS